MQHLYKALSIILLGFCFLQPNGVQAQTWVQKGLDIDGEANYDYSGNPISLSADGNTLAIGSLYNDANRGHVKVYKRTLNSWTQIGAKIIGEAVGDKSGFSVSLSADGNIVAIGAIFNAGGGGIFRGHVRVYKNISGNWTQQGSDIDGEANFDQSGCSVSLSSDGTIVAIGALQNAGAGSNRGHVRVYKNIGGTWTQQGLDIDGEDNSDRSGYSVSLSADGTIVAIGAPLNSGGGAYRGHVRVYKYISGTWTQLGVDINGEADSDLSGYSVSLSADGTIVAIGAPNNSGGGTQRGHVRVYKYISGTWTQLGVDINGEADIDLSGYSVSISADGNIVAIGATYNEGGGINRGHGRVYKYISGTWTQQGLDIDGEANHDNSGGSVSLSADGNILAIGAQSNDGAGGIDRGHVRVFSFCSYLNNFLGAVIANVQYTNKKVYICHQGNTLEVGYSNLLEHLAHGDILGQCGLTYCDILQIRSNELSDFIVPELNESSAELFLYPNPAQNILNIKLPALAEQTIQIQVYNSLGQEILAKEYFIHPKGDDNIPVNIQNIAQGLYMLKVSGEGYARTKGFTKF